MGIGSILFGLLILAAGLFACYVKHIHVKESETVSGVIKGFLEKKRRSNYVYETVYCPVVEYEKDGRKITAEHHDYSASIGLHYKGETVLIYVHPKMPKKFYFIDECKGADLAGVVIASCGALIVIFGIIVLAIS